FDLLRRLADTRATDRPPRTATRQLRRGRLSPGPRRAALERLTDRRDVARGRTDIGTWRALQSIDRAPHLGNFTRQSIHIARRPLCVREQEAAERREQSDEHRLVSIPSRLVAFP